MRHCRDGEVATCSCSGVRGPGRGGRIEVDMTENIYSFSSG